MLGPARAFDRILRVARTISDLESALTLPDRDSADYPAALASAIADPGEVRHIAETITYCNLDRASYGTVY